MLPDAPPPFSVSLIFAIAMTLPLVFDSDDPPISYIIADSKKYTTICHTLIVQFLSANMTRSAIIKELEAIGGCIMKRRPSKGSRKIFNRRWRAHFGASLEVCCDAWVLLPDWIKTDMKYFLWAILFFKLYPKENVACTMVGGIDEKTWRNKIWPMIEQLSLLELIKVSTIYLLLIVHMSNHF